VTSLHYRQCLMYLCVDVAILPNYVPFCQYVCSFRDTSHVFPLLQNKFISCYYMRRYFIPRFMTVFFSHMKLKNSSWSLHRSVDSRYTVRMFCFTKLSFPRPLIHQFYSNFLTCSFSYCHWSY